MKITKITFGVLISIGIIVQLFVPANINPPLALAASEDLTLGKCLQGDLDLDTFLQSIISQHGLTDSFVEYWKDLLFRNRCQSMDILSLSKQQDKVQKQLQTAFLQCHREKIPALKKAYYKIDAEIYYVRRLVTVGDYIASFSEDLTLNEEEQKNQNKIYLNDMAPVYDQMKDIYSRYIGSDQEFENYYAALTVKYTDRKFNYISCPDNAWQALSDKIHEFLNNWGGAKEGTEAMKKAVVSEAMRIKRTAITRPPFTFGTFVSNTFKMRLNELTPEYGLAEITNRLKQLSPSTSGSPNLGDVTAAAGVSGDTYQEKYDRAEAEARYKALYFYTTDAATREFVDTVNDLLGTIQEGSFYIDSVASCTSNVINRECP